MNFIVAFLGLNLIIQQTEGILGNIIQKLLLWFLNYTRCVNHLLILLNFEKTKQNTYRTKFVTINLD